MRPSLLLPPQVLLSADVRVSLKTNAACRPFFWRQLQCAASSSDALQQKNHPRRLFPTHAPLRSARLPFFGVTPDRSSVSLMPSLCTALVTTPPPSRPARPFHPSAAVRACCHARRPVTVLSCTRRTGQEDARAESNDLLARVESRASKEHVKACLGGKADQGELAELRSCVDR